MDAITRSGIAPSELKAAAQHADKYQALLGVAMPSPCEAGPLAARLQELTRQFSRAAAEESALLNTDNFELSEETVRRDAKHMGELGSFEALIDYHNAVQKQAGLNLGRVNTVLSNDPEIKKIREIVENGAVIDVAPEFRAIHRTAPFRNLQHNNGCSQYIKRQWQKCMPKTKCCFSTWKTYHH